MSSTLDAILEKVNILDVVSRYVNLKKRGKDFVGLCPFHSEKTPSFTVSVEKQIYYCFGCHEGGNVVNFIMKYENMDFKDAMESIAREYGIEIRKEKGRRSSSLDALGKLADYYHYSLKETRHVLDYLINRGIDLATIDEFKLGYSDRDKTGFKAFIKNLGVLSDLLLSTGILRMKNGEIYDMFIGRVVIPIFDVNRRVIGFGGRTLEKEGQPKYINSPESSIFSKGTTLFGIDKTRKYISEANEAIIVEGYFDFISLYKVGIKNIVATLGTSVTEAQLKKLRTYTENITLMLDGDEAGIKSGLRLLGLLSQLDINGYMVVLPEGEDPDSFSRKNGYEATKRVIDTKKPIMEYYFDYVMANNRLDTLEKRSLFLRTVLPHVEEIKDGIKKRLYMKRLSELTGIEEYLFWDRMKKETRGNKTEEVPYSIIEKKIIGALLDRPQMINLFKEKGVIDHIAQGDVREVLSVLFKTFEKTGNVEVNSFISLFEREDLRNLIISSVFDAKGYEGGELDKVLVDYLRHVERKSVMERAKMLTEMLVEAEKKKDEKLIVQLLEEKRRVLAFMKTNT